MPEQLSPLFYSKKVLIVVALSLISRFVAAQEESPATATPPQGYEFSFPALGTLVSFTAYAADESQVQAAFELAEKRVHELEAVLTDYDPASETRKLSEQAVRRPTRVSADLWRMLVSCDAWYVKTDGAFDASLGKLTRLWRKHRRVKRVPSRAEIESALAQTGWQHVVLDTERQSIELLQEGVQLDFGAIGKGYIADRAFEVLVDSGLSCCLVNLSGNLRCGAAPPGRDGWRIDISPLKKGGRPLRRIVIANQAVATSGDLWQFTLVDGQRRSHILDPSTGLGVVGPIAATALAPSATEADACATAACVMGAEQAIQFVDSIPNLELLVATQVDPESQPLVTSTAGFAK